ncbi:DnaJ-domain-containing protein, partial [Coniophora puteana RWD-64-598 SS2]
MDEYPQPVDHYFILNIPPDATEDMIKQAFRKLALQWHPDRHNAGKEYAAQMFIQVHASYRALMETKDNARTRSPPSPPPPPPPSFSSPYSFPP